MLVVYVLVDLALGAKELYPSFNAIDIEVLMLVKFNIKATVRKLLWMHNKTPYITSDS